MTILYRASIDNWHTTKPGQLTMQMILFFESNLPADHPIMSRRSALHRDAAAYLFFSLNEMTAKSATRKFSCLFTQNSF